MVAATVIVVAVLVVGVLTFRALRKASARVESILAEETRECRDRLEPAATLTSPSRIRSHI